METTKIKNLPNAQSGWDRFVEDYVEVFVRALNKLRELGDKLPSDEDSLSEILAADLLEQACREILIETDTHLDIPQWERPIPPNNSQELRDGQLGKRPDFTCVCPNRRSGWHENYEIHLHIECKLLGKRSENQRNYVVNGIQRFDNTDHQYGKNAHTGLMIGYILGQLPEDIQKNVNKHIDKYIQYHEYLQFVFNSDAIYKYSSSFVRQQVQPFDFSIIHIWVDLC
jgi:hypothetical protein